MPNAKNKENGKPAKSGKKQLTRQEEFEILKLVLDKFLLLGFGIMAFGLYELNKSASLDAFYIMFAGAAVLIIFTLVLIKEYEILK